MSRIGKVPISLPHGVEVKLEGTSVEVRGPKGTMTHTIPKGINIHIDNGIIQIKREGDSKKSRSLHGLTRTLIANMVVGVTQEFAKKLEIVGVGYRANLQGRVLQLSLGYSHPIVYSIPEGIEVMVEKQTSITIKGIDKQKVGQVAAVIRGFRKPEPYKKKGIRYEGEVIRTKAGKAKG